MPAVSVVIPTFNYAHYLPKAIRSVLAQPDGDLEILVVDDGSEDRPEEAVARFDDPRLRLIRQQNAGLSAARNTGIREASAPFVVFLDADDEWLPGFLRQTREAFARLGDGFSVVACNSLRVDDSGTRLGERKALADSDREITARDLIERNRFMPSSALVRKSAFEKAGLFDTSLRSSEDRDMWVRIAAVSRIYLLAEPQVLIRKHGSNMSRNADRMRENMRRVIGKAKAAGVVPLSDRGFWRRVDATNWHEVAWMHHDEGRHLLAAGETLRSIFAWPIFPRPSALNEPPLFRLRALRRFLWAGLVRRPPGGAGG